MQHEKMQYEKKRNERARDQQQGVVLRDVWLERGGNGVLERVDVAIPEGACCAIVGPSGIGKTSLLQLLAGALRPSRGEVCFRGYSLPPEFETAHSIIGAQCAVRAHLSVRQHLLLALEGTGDAMFGRRFGVRRRRAFDRVDDLLDIVGMSAVADQFPAALSPALRQRLAIAEAVLREPRMLLLDEPFVGLDLAARASLETVLRAIWKRSRLTMFIATEDIGEAFALGTRVLVLDRFDDASSGGASITYDIPVSHRGAAAPRNRSLSVALEANTWRKSA